MAGVDKDKVKAVVFEMSKVLALEVIYICRLNELNF